MGFPWTVGMAPGASDDEVDDGDVALLEEELIELMLFIASPAPISFRGIDLLAPAGPGLSDGAESFDSADFRASSSLGFRSCGGCGVLALSGATGFFGMSDLGAPIGGSLRYGNGDIPTGLPLEVLSPEVPSECDSFFADPALFPFGTSPSLNFSPDIWLFVLFVVDEDSTC
jgi:hypothetical protein